MRQIRTQIVTHCQSWMAPGEVLQKLPIDGKNPFLVHDRQMILTGGEGGMKRKERGNAKIAINRLLIR